MRYLLDTHTFLWYVNGGASLSPVSNALISDANNLVYLSTASIWEMAIKSSRKKLAMPAPLHSFVDSAMIDNEVALLVITTEHADIVANLPFHDSGHKDPFDRMIIAQSICEDLPVISRDRVFDDYDVERIW